MWPENDLFHYCWTFFYYFPLFIFTLDIDLFYPKYKEITLHMVELFLQLHLLIFFIG